MVGLVLCCSLRCVVAGLGYVVGFIGFRCHIMLPGVGGNAWWSGGTLCVVTVMVVCA